MKSLWALFVSFFKTGLFTFGGGYAMLPLLKAETVQKRRWLSEDELLDYFSIGQCTPGIIAVNVSTFCGYKVKGITGAVLATTAMVLPSLIIIILIASVLKNYINVPLVASAFAGIRLGVSALLFNLILDMAKKLFNECPNKVFHGGIFLTALVLLIGVNISSVWIVIMAAAAGTVPSLLRRSPK